MAELKTVRERVSEIADWLESSNALCGSNISSPDEIGGNFYVTFHDPEAMRRALAGSGATLKTTKHCDKTEYSAEHNGIHLRCWKYKSCLGSVVEEDVL